MTWSEFAPFGGEAWWIQAIAWLLTLADFVGLVWLLQWRERERERFHADMRARGIVKVGRHQWVNVRRLVADELAREDNDVGRQRRGSGVAIGSSTMHEEGRRAVRSRSARSGPAIPLCRSRSSSEDSCP